MLWTKHVQVKIVIITNYIIITIIWPFTGLLSPSKTSSWVKREKHLYRSTAFSSTLWTVKHHQTNRLSCWVPRAVHTHMRNGEGHVPVGVKGDWFSLAHLALESALELSHEDVSYGRAVNALIPLPELHTFVIVTVREAMKKNIL